jgi:hypothetical protein
VTEADVDWVRPLELEVAAACRDNFRLGFSGSKNWKPPHELIGELIGMNFAPTARATRAPIAKIK